uniref:Uncharacterized protein n=1 Tax=Anguilla anguilla TaxID=7936 RepID=A0A0E9XUL0_ANGAN
MVQSEHLFQSACSPSEPAAEG